MAIEKISGVIYARVVGVHAVPGSNGNPDWCKISLGGVLPGLAVVDLEITGDQFDALDAVKHQLIAKYNGGTARWLKISGCVALSTTQNPAPDGTVYTNHKLLTKVRPTVRTSLRRDPFTPAKIEVLSKADEAALRGETPDAVATPGGVVDLSGL
jgi:hypothetical protein